MRWTDLASALTRWVQIERGVQPPRIGGSSTPVTDFMFNPLYNACRVLPETPN